jgi:hypothetical protein
VEPYIYPEQTRKLKLIFKQVTRTDVISLSGRSGSLANALIQLHVGSNIHQPLSNAMWKFRISGKMINFTIIKKYIGGRTETEVLGRVDI